MPSEKNLRPKKQMPRNADTGKRRLNFTKRHKRDAEKNIMERDNPLWDTYYNTDLKAFKRKTGTIVIGGRKASARDVYVNAYKHGQLKPSSGYLFDTGKGRLVKKRALAEGETLNGSIIYNGKYTNSADIPDEALNKYKQGDFTMTIELYGTATQTDSRVDGISRCRNGVIDNHKNTIDVTLITSAGFGYTQKVRGEAHLTLLCDPKIVYVSAAQLEIFHKKPYIKVDDGGNRYYTGSEDFHHIVRLFKNDHDTLDFEYRVDVIVITHIDVNANPVHRAPEQQELGATNVPQILSNRYMSLKIDSSNRLQLISNLPMATDDNCVPLTVVEWKGDQIKDLSVESVLRICDHLYSTRMCPTDLVPFLKMHRLSTTILNVVGEVIFHWNPQMVGLSRQKKMKDTHLYAIAHNGHIYRMDGVPDDPKRSKKSFENRKFPGFQATAPKMPSDKFRSPETTDYVAWAETQTQVLDVLATPTTEKSVRIGFCGGCEFPRKPGDLTRMEKLLLYFRETHSFEPQLIIKNFTIRSMTIWTNTTTFVISNIGASKEPQKFNDWLNRFKRAMFPGKTDENGSSTQAFVSSYSKNFQKVFTALRMPPPQARFLHDVPTHACGIDIARCFTGALMEEERLTKLIHTDDFRTYSGEPIDDETFYIIQNDDVRNDDVRWETHLIQTKIQTKSVPEDLSSRQRHMFIHQPLGNLRSTSCLVCFFALPGDSKDACHIPCGGCSELLGLNDTCWNSTYTEKVFCDLCYKPWFDEKFMWFKDGEFFIAPVALIEKEDIGNVKEQKALQGAIEKYLMCGKQLGCLKGHALKECGIAFPILYYCKPMNTYDNPFKPLVKELYESGASSEIQKNAPNFVIGTAGRMVNRLEQTIFTTSHEEACSFASSDKDVKTMERLGGFYAKRDTAEVILKSGYYPIQNATHVNARLALLRLYRRLVAEGITVYGVNRDCFLVDRDPDWDFAETTTFETIGCARKELTFKPVPHRLWQVERVKLEDRPIPCDSHVPVIVTKKTPGIDCAVSGGPGDGKSYTAALDLNPQTSLFITSCNKRCEDIRQGKGLPNGQGFEAITCSAALGIRVAEEGGEVFDRAERCMRNLSKYKAIVLDEMAQNDHLLISRLMELKERYPDIWWICNGDENQNTLSSLPMKEHKAFYRDVLRRFFPQHINLDYSYRLKTDEDRQMRAEIFKELFVENQDASDQTRIGRVIAKYFGKRCFSDVRFLKRAGITKATTLSNPWAHEVNLVINDGAEEKPGSKVILKTWTKDFVKNKEYTVEAVGDKTFTIEGVELSQMRFRLPYVFTGFSAQGDTWAESYAVFQAGSPFASVEWFWTAITRCTQFSDVWIYTGPSLVDQYSISAKIAGYKEQDVKAGRKNNLTRENVLDFLNSKNFKCDVCHHRMTWEKHKQCNDEQWTLDRIDAEKGHTFADKTKDIPGNLRTAHWACNRAHANDGKILLPTEEEDAF